MSGTAGRRARVAAVLGGLALASSSCGYTSSRLVQVPGVRTIAIAQFENETYRRDLEFRLTRAVAEEVRARTPWRIETPANADAVLTGTIRSADTGVLAEDPEGRPDVQRFTVWAEARLVERRTGRVLRSWRTTDVQEWAEGRFGESLEGYATDEIVRRLAEKVVAGLESPIGTPSRAPPPRGEPRRRPRSD